MSESTVFHAPDAEVIVAAVALRPADLFPDRYMFLDEITAACFAPGEDGPSLWDRVYRAGLVKDGAEYKYQTLDAIRDHLGVSNDDLAPLLKAMNRPAHAVEAARARMLEAAQRRSMDRKLDKAKSAIRNPEQAVDVLVSDTTRALFDVTVTSKKPGKTAAEVARSYGKNNAWAQFPPPIIYRSEHPMDTTPFGMGAYNVYLAPPGTGKTVMALWKAVETAQNGGHVLWNGWEMDAADLLDMIVSRYTGIQYKRLIDAREGESIGDERLIRSISEDERRGRDAFLAEMFADGSWGNRLRFLTGSDALPMNNLLPLVRRLRAGGMCDLLVLDHLHIATVLDEKGRMITDPFQRATAASGWARDIARETGVPMYVAAQFSRSRKEAKQEGDAPNLYTMEMIRASGAIEEDAFGITAIQIVQYNPRTAEVARLNPANPDTLRPGYVKAIMGQVLKNRKGGGRLTTWTIPIVDGAFDYVLSSQMDDMIRTMKTAHYTPEEAEDAAVLERVLADHNAAVQRNTIEQEELF